MKDRNTDYAQTLNEEVDRWSRKLEEFRAAAEEKASAAADSAKMEYQKRLGQLEEKQQDARSRVDALRSAASEATDELRRGAGEAVEDLRSSVERAQQTLR